MDTQKKQQLNKFENILYTVIVAAIITDIWSGETHIFIFIFSTIILVAGIIGIVSIELVKLQWKQRQKKIKN